jgi:hypothetical protein
MRRCDVVILTAITLEYQAALKVEAGAWEGSRWEEEKGPNGLPVSFRTFRGQGGRPLRVAVAQAGDMGPGRQPRTRSLHHPRDATTSRAGACRPPGRAVRQGCPAWPP